MHPLIAQPRAEIQVLAQRRGIENVRVFGSITRGNAGEAGDVDLLVSVLATKAAWRSADC